jgi:hypothetical protein
MQPPSQPGRAEGNSDAQAATNDLHRQQANDEVPDFSEGLRNLKQTMNGAIGKMVKHYPKDAATIRSFAFNTMPQTRTENLHNALLHRIHVKFEKQGLSI